MTPDQEPPNPTGPTERSEPSPSPRRRRRSGRGHRGRGRRPQPLATQTQPAPAAEAEPGPQTEAPGETQAAEVIPEVRDELAATSPPSTAEVPPPASPKSKPQPKGQFVPAPPETIQEAIEQVRGIIGTLSETLEDMEEVLQTLELAERQQDADERELQSLRQALHHLQRPREGGHPAQRHRPHEPR